MNRQFTQEVQMAYQNMRRYITPSEVREMQTSQLWGISTHWSRWSEWKGKPCAGGGGAVGDRQAGTARVKAGTREPVCWTQYWLSRGPLLRPSGSDNLSAPWFLHLSDEIWMSHSIHMKCLQECLVHSKSHITVSHYHLGRGCRPHHFLSVVVEQTCTLEPERSFVQQTLTKCHI